jgi:dTDP-4-amino-4,6-dideoxygalactose transaminase
MFTADGGVAERTRSLLAHGRGEHAYDHRYVGINGRLDTIQAAVLLEKLDLLGEELDARQRVADRYTVALADVVATPTIAAGVTSAWAQYTIRTPARSSVAAAMAEQGVPTAVHYPLPVHRQPAYRRYPVAPGGLPGSEALAASVLSLPMHPYLTEAAQQRVVDALRRAVAAVPAGSVA